MPSVTALEWLNRAVIVLLDGDMVIDIDLGLFPERRRIGLVGQRQERRFFLGLEPTIARTGELLERRRIEFGQLLIGEGLGEGFVAGLQHGHKLKTQGHLTSEKLNDSWFYRTSSGNSFTGAAAGKSAPLGVMRMRKDCLGFPPTDSLLRFDEVGEGFGQVTQVRSEIRLFMEDSFNRIGSR